jgi:hypothetical protein
VSRSFNQDVVDQVDHRVKEFLSHRDADRFFKSMYSIKWTGVDSFSTNGVFRLALERILEASPDHSGPAVMSLVMSIAAEKTINEVFPGA